MFIGDLKRKSIHRRRIAARIDLAYSIEYNYCHKQSYILP